MSLSKAPKTQMRNFEVFRLPSLQGEAGLSLPASGNFVLQPFEGNVPRKAAYSESELTLRADHILAETEAKRQYIEQQAYEEGFRQGQKDGQEVGRRGLEEIVQRFEHMLAALVAEKEAFYHRRERDLVELALAVSRKIIGRELTIQPEAIRDLVAAACQNLYDTERLQLMIHPQDYEFFIHHSQVSWPLGMEVIADSALTPGSFKLETDQGEIDGTLETRWAKVNAAIDKILERRHED
jgi:flagellar assembly protein FliH